MPTVDAADEVAALGCAKAAAFVSWNAVSGARGSGPRAQQECISQRACLPGCTISAAQRHFAADNPDSLLPALDPRFRP